MTSFFLAGALAQVKESPTMKLHNVIDWAPYPLATAEVAAILESSIADAGQALEASSAVRTETRGGPYWSRG